MLAVSFAAIADSLTSTNAALNHVHSFVCSKTDNCSAVLQLGHFVQFEQMLCAAAKIVGGF